MLRIQLSQQVVRGWFGFDLVFFFFSVLCSSTELQPQAGRAWDFPRKGSNYIIEEYYGVSAEFYLYVKSPDFCSV